MNFRHEMRKAKRFGRSPLGQSMIGTAKVGLQQTPVGRKILRNRKKIGQVYGLTKDIKRTFR